MSDQASISEAFTLLRSLCDPRGHDLLRTLESLCLCESIALDSVIEAIPAPKHSSNVIPMIRDYSVKA